MNNQTKWTDTDFDQMSWHDCHINAIAFDQTEETQSDLVLNLDYIVEWLCGTDKTCSFRIAPAILRFVDVDNLSIHFSMQFNQPVEIYSIERVILPPEDYKNFHWTIALQNYPELKLNYINFDATGYIQELTGKIIQSTSQHLTAEQRKQFQEL